MKVFLAIALFAAVCASTQAVLNCYTCNSKDDASCIDNPTSKMNCGHVIADLSSDRFRCMTVHAKEGDEELVFRRCAVNNECKWQVENKRFSWGSQVYTNAVCDECVGDFCNKEKLL